VFFFFKSQSKSNVQKSDQNLDPKITKIIEILGNKRKTKKKVFYKKHQNLKLRKRLASKFAKKNRKKDEKNIKKTRF